MKRTGAAVVIATFAALDVAPPSSASCAGPVLMLEAVDQSVGSRPVLRLGQEVTVEGRHFVTGCNDVGGGTACNEIEEEPVEPHTDVWLTLRQGGRTWELGEDDAGTADENQLGWTEWQFLVPAEARPGRAVLVTPSAELGVRLIR